MTKHPEPFNFWGEFAAPELSPADVPQVISGFAREQAAITGLDAAGLSVAAIAGCASAISNRILLHVDDRVESARFWAALVGGSDCDSKRIMKIATSPLHDVEDRYRQEYEDQLQDGVDPDEGRLYRKRILLEGVFLKSILAVMRRAQGEGLLVTHEEIGRDVMFDKARPLYVRAYDGGPNVWDSDQDDRGTFDLPFCSMSLLAGLNPAAVPADMWDKDLLTRLMPIVLQPQKGVLPVGGTSGFGMTARYARLVEDLSELETVRFQTRHWESARLELSTVARMAFDGIENRYRNFRNFDLINHRMSELFARYPIVFLRLCVIFHCVNHIGEPHLPTEIEGETARQVARFMVDFLEPHALAFFSRHVGLSRDGKELKLFAEHLLAKRIERTSRGKLRQSNSTIRKMDYSIFQMRVAQLEALGWIIREDPTDASFEINPRCHVLYERQGQIERERRERLLASWREATSRKRTASDHGEG